MPRLKWTTSHAVYMPEIDDEHKQIFQAVAQLQECVISRAIQSELHSRAQRLATSVLDHFAHEERLMRAARYSSLRWHKQQHDAVRRRLQQCASRIEKGDAEAALELIDYLPGWLGNHTRLADRMMGAFLRNQRRGMWTLTFRAGTQPAAARKWLNSKGEQFDPEKLQKN